MKFKNNLILFVLTFLVFIAPSFLYSLIDANYNVAFEFSIIAYILGALLLSFSPKPVVYGVLTLFVVMELIQFAHISYYKFPISPHTLGLIWDEKDEILEAGFGDLKHIWYFPFLVLIPYGTLLFLYRKMPKKSSYIIAILMFLFLGFEPYRVAVKHRTINSFTPVKSRISLHNSIKSFSYFIFGPKTNSIANYKPYSYIQSEADNINIVLIFGESVNYNFMSLFDFDEKTNPKLELIKDKLIYKKAFSSSPLTLISTSMFFNVTREPDNVNNQIKGDVNLFKLAKQNGFKTAYLSAQERNLVLKIQPDNIDEIITKETGYFGFNKKSDFYLIDLLKDKKDQITDKTKKNFIVLHQRNAHAPYPVNYENHPEFDVFKSDDRKSSYKNAMLMNDAFIYNVINELEQMSYDKPTYIYFVPDHSESFGDIDGKFGHGFLGDETTNIPFIYTCFNCKKDKEIESLFYPTHYEIAKIIAKKLGFNILNPNDNGDLYINGPSIYGAQGYWTLKKDIENKKFDIIKN